MPPECFVLLSGQTHEVITAICLVTGARPDCSAQTRNHVCDLLRLNEDEIRAYVASHEPFDKAGAYAIQGLASKFVDPHFRLLFQRGRPSRSFALCDSQDGTGRNRELEVKRS